MNLVKKIEQIEYISCSIIAAIIVCLDQISKSAIKNLLSGDETRFIPINKILNLVLSFNYGVSFGLFNKPNTSKWIITIIAILIIFGLAVFMIYCSKLHRIGCSFMIGGAIGNIIDRIHYGAVVDFIDFHWHNWHYPSFNIADTFIVIGAFLLLIPENKKARTDVAIEIHKS